MDVADTRSAGGSLLERMPRIFHVCKLLREKILINFGHAVAVLRTSQNFKKWPVTNQVSTAGVKAAEHLQYATL